MTFQKAGFSRAHETTLRHQCDLITSADQEVVLAEVSMGSNREMPDCNDFKSTSIKPSGELSVTDSLNVAPDSHNWIDIEIGPHHNIDRIAKSLGIDPSPYHSCEGLCDSSAIYHSPGQTFLRTHLYKLSKEDGQIQLESTPVSFFLRDGEVITIHNGDASVLSCFRDSLAEQESYKTDPAALFSHLLEVTIGSNRIVLAQLQQHLDETRESAEEGALSRTQLQSLSRAEIAASDIANDLSFFTEALVDAGGKTSILNRQCSERTKERLSAAILQSQQMANRVESRAQSLKDGETARRSDNMTTAGYVLSGVLAASAAATLFSALEMPMLKTASEFLKNNQWGQAVLVAAMGIGAWAYVRAMRKSIN